jgi:dTDP-4-dehydrorhamnose reductase
MPRPRVLVLGATGFLGAFAVAVLRQRADVVTGGRRSADVAVDLADGAVAAAVAAVGADRVLNLAALSRIADCSREPALAHAVNARAPGELAMALGPRLVHVSTDLVFDGRAAPYAAFDPVAPLSVYGQTKAEGEELALARGARIVRLPLLFGPDAQGRGATAMLRAALAAARPQALFTNEYRTPLHAADAADALADLVLRDALPRIVHVAGPERVSRWELAQRFCRTHGLSTSWLEPVECQDAMRPRDVSLRGMLPQRTLAEMLADS